MSQRGSSGPSEHQICHLWSLQQLQAHSYLDLRVTKVKHTKIQHAQWKVFKELTDGYLSTTGLSRVTCMLLMYNSILYVFCVLESV